LTGSADLDHATYLHYMGALIQDCNRPFPEQSKSTKQMLLELDHMSTTLSFTRNLVPALTPLPERSAHSAAACRNAATALAIERYRLKHHALPAQLSDLVPEYLNVVPDDPFDLQPLRYRPLEQGYVVYSIGPDGIDDGGKERPRHDSETEPETFDITFTVAK
jgi:hypothetical protein